MDDEQTTMIEEEQLTQAEQDALQRIADRNNADRLGGLVKRDIIAGREAAVKAERVRRGRTEWVEAV